MSMRKYINMVAPLTESILAELETVPLPGNESKEVGADGQSVTNDMTDILPHHGVFERNKPQAFSQIFAHTVGRTYETGFERETPPSTDDMKPRRNTHYSVKNWLKSVPEKGDSSSILHSDFARAKHNDRSVIPGKK
jgi:hypothetical protein